MPQQDCPLGSQFQFINARRLCSTPILISKYQLTRVPGQLRGEGPENFVIGDKNFATEKFILSFATKSGPRQITLWTIKPGVVLAMEDSRLATGLRVVLSQYKKFSDF
jgi:hypothetical protein